MSLAVSAADFPVPEEANEAPAAKRGFLSRMFNAAVKAAPTAAVSAGLGFALRTAALSTTVAAGASTGVTIAAIAAASGTTAAVVTFGKEWWASRKDEEARKALFTKATAKKVGTAFALASGFGALGGLVAPTVIDYVKNIDFASAGEKIANFFIPTAAAFDYSHGDPLFMNAPGTDLPTPVKAAAVAAAPASAPLAADSPASAPRNAPPTAPVKPAAPVSADPVPSKPQAPPPPQPPATPNKSVPMERLRTLLAEPGAKAPRGLDRLETLSAQQLKDKGVEALWKHKNPALARALFEASGNTQARQALNFMNAHGMGLPKGAAVAEGLSKPAPGLVEKGPGLKARLAAACTMPRTPMEGLELACDLKNPTMYPGDHIDVTDKKGKLTQIFYEGASKLRRSVAEAISTTSFLTERVAPVILREDPGIRAYINRIPVRPDGTIILAAH